MQLGPGASASYGAIDLRRALFAGKQEGVIGVNGGAYKVTAGGGMNVSVAASTADGALVQGDSVTHQGLIFVPPHSAAITETISAAHATLPRIDSVILEVLDATHDGGGSNLARIRPLTGTASAGATLDNRTGFPALPASALLLADVLMPAAAASVLAANIRDRRPFANGAYHRVVRNANAAAGNDYTSASASFVEIDATNLKPRIECSGRPVRVRLAGAYASTITNGRTAIGLAIDGAFSDGGAGNGSQFIMHAFSTANSALAANPVWTFTPTAGSHQFSVLWATVDGGTSSLWARAAVPLELEIEELVRQNTSNS